MAEIASQLECGVVAIESIAICQIFEFFHICHSRHTPQCHWQKWQNIVRIEKMVSFSCHSHLLKGFLGHSIESMSELFSGALFVSEVMIESLNRVERQEDLIKPL
jgi:hypothetical protein